MSEIIESPITGLNAVIVKNRKEIPEGAEIDPLDKNEYFEVWVKGLERFYYKYPPHLVRSRWKA